MYPDTCSTANTGRRHSARTLHDKLPGKGLPSAGVSTVCVDARQRAALPTYTSIMEKLCRPTPVGATHTCVCEPHLCLTMTRRGRGGKGREWFHSPVCCHTLENCNDLTRWPTALTEAYTPRGMHPELKPGLAVTQS